MRTGKFKTALLASVATAFGASSASAQEAEVQAQDGAVQTANVIVVTAQRREEKLQDVSMAVSVQRPEDFVDSGLTRLRDVIAYTPGVVFSEKQGQPTGANLIVRGVGQFGFGNFSTATTGVYLDTAALTSNSPWGNNGLLAFDGLLGDVERIEVLKGPQGTLYGSTSVGGAVKYITRKPSLDEIRGHASSDVSFTKEGGVNHLHSARLSVPIATDRLGVTVAGFFEDNGGLIDRVDLATGALLLEDADAYERYGLSGDVYFQATDRLSLRARALRQRADYNARGLVKLDAATREPLYSLYSSPLETQDYYTETNLLTGIIEYDFDFATLTSTSAYTEDDLFSNGDIYNLVSGFIDATLGLPAGTIDSVPQLLVSGSEKFTQEIQLSSKRNEEFEWILGYYFADESTFRFSQSTATPGDFLLLDTSSPSEYREHALFGNVTYYLTPKFDISVGARLSFNEMKFSDFVSGLVTANPPPFENATESDTVDTYSFAVRYRPVDDLSLYARVASGYRPATATRIVSDGVISLPTVTEADSLWSYEFGAKGSVANDLLTYDLALWYIDWKDFQALLSLNPFVGGVGNAEGGITGKGIEASIALNPFDGFSLTSNMAYTDSTLDADEPFLHGLEGQSVPDVPKWTFSSRANYGFALTETIDATFGLGARYQSSSRSAFTDGEAFVPGVSDPAGGPYDLQINIPSDSYLAVDANIGFVRDNVALNIYATNLFNKEALLGLDGTFTLGASTVTAVPLRPRTIGVNMSVDF